MSLLSIRIFHFFFLFSAFVRSGCVCDCGVDALLSVFRFERQFSSDDNIVIVEAFATSESIDSFASVDDRFQPTLFVECELSSVVFSVRLV